MAKNLNKSRMRQSQILVILVFVIAFFTQALIPVESITHEFFDYAGYILIAICALGRVYASAFLGGHKNKNLITYGPFSVVRNPLYVFSLIGITGIGLISAHIILMVFLPVSFLIIYHFLIAREEEFLQQTFGDTYTDYKNKTPRLIPNFKRYHVPDNIEVVPKYLNNAFRDSIWWFAAFPLFEVAEYLSESGILPALFVMP